MALFHSRAHAGRLADATHCGTAGTPGQGPSITLWLRVENGVISNASYKAWGCPSAISAAEILSQKIEGLAPEAAKRITAAEVTEWLEGVPEGKEHCPRLAVEACQAALTSAG